MVSGILSIFLAAPLFLADMPASTNYKLHDFTFGPGGSDSSASSNYKLEGISSEASGAPSSSTNYKTNSGFISTQQANVPGAPTFTNPSNYYDKLHFVINTGSNPTDATFAIAISTDDFATTNYIQNDNTVGASLGTEDYQTYASWGSGTGEDVIGLSYNTTYKIKVKAFHGDFTESAYGPTASASTVGQQLSFDIDVSATDSETAAPYATNFGNLPPATVTDAPEKVWFDFATNANNGGDIYMYGQNSGLNSATRSYTLSSASGDLSSLEEGYGAQSSSATQSSGGPLSAVSPYNVSAQNVGIINTTIRQIYTSSAALSGGRASFLLKAKSKTTTPPATDYTDTITAIAVGNY